MAAVSKMKLELSELTAVSPVDGRYASKTRKLRNCFSEFALIRNRCFVEVEWIKYMCAHPEFHQMKELSPSSIAKLDLIITDFSLASAKRVKDIEATTRHDVKAVEYFLKESVVAMGKGPPDQDADTELSRIAEFFHFGCTSEDVNNLSWAISLSQARDKVILPAMKEIMEVLILMSRLYCDAPMMSRTHGQSATPSTMGKELSTFANRLYKQMKAFENVEILGKFNGAVGNFNAHVVAFPDIDWITVSKEFVESFGFQFNSHTTQIEPHDYIAELFDAVERFNTVLLDLSKDMWAYISLGYFTQRKLEGEVGSSTMPHKVNPIDFENAEGNLGLANAILSHMASKLPISRMQRDLTDSTVLRNLGVGFSYCLIAYSSLHFGLKKVEANRAFMLQELDKHWELLAEPIQTVMRKHGMETPYEVLKALTQGKEVTQQMIHDFIKSLPAELPEQERRRLLELTPAKYIGLAKVLALQLPDIDAIGKKEDGKE
eukprot:CAMPEP_0184698334 /NCGR_PEP_ID=MMETSP0313-20130426/4993_1 /TAXON_ID=2792 /ORGANISM="Porphyridium aerugineum, Strain SAG 1380-2" /LENGTH=489 /DNA_ID=CAMNT_0027157261 /DNA_START=21 /DNA_END=1490 /DNA_ORIENTATION=-